ncbi:MULTISPECIES: DUF2726 domain-containing protein [unclassified Variovorax]|uniref:DUF2726 domain-containing protein n=1 Tax=unclassified Variovorax TaxID=663243 RepID=UPI0008380BE5|nr:MULTISPECIES: DUF2726 domain-containing protein [unclassified Variovorax]PNG50001.1 hypothetical protein CHC06_05582 [Variovorax sp. B2]PNG50873.1 hypothetical protein CHC07_05487 [Variovorax sp. B4]VTU41606.1 hypothetical protein H6P1_00006 [Variovorax sp. PBL-H6]VTU44695.1 hypothetical protein SRS16P1_00897 [Variovorax sp. SRS16]VTU44736.1 hypothetical protein E5P1_00889 [Variovorax sp. PBL-E5]
MHFGVFVGILLALALGALVAVGYRRHLATRELRVGRHGFTRRPLLTGNEVDFFRKLQRALGSEFQVLPQVSMGAVMATTLTPEHPDYWAVRESYASKIIDFVVCDPKHFQPLLVVELDDRMHDFSKDRTRDSLVARCGLRTVRFWSRKKPDIATLRVELHRHLGHAVSKTH